MYNSLETTTNETVKVISRYINAELTGLKDVVDETAMLPDIYDTKVPTADKKKLMDQKLEAHDFAEYDIVTTKGKSIFGKENKANEEFFKKAVKGESVIAEPMSEEGHDDMHIHICAPIRENGLENGKVLGVVIFALDAKWLTDIVADVQIGDSGTVYVLDNTGVVLAHPNYDLVLEQSNSIEDAKSDSKLEDIAKLETEMINGKSGFGMYYYNGHEKLMSYTNIEDTNGWSVAVTLGYTEFMGGAGKCGIIILVVSLVLILLGFYYLLVIARKIANPITICANRIEALAEGDLTSPMPEINTNDETKILADSTSKILGQMEHIIGDMDYMLGEMKNGNFDVHSKSRDNYVGDFKSILASVNGIRDSLSDTLMQINEAADQVASGSEQVSIASQSLAQGATEQAASVNELDSRVTQINNEIISNAKKAFDAKTQTENAGVKIVEANEQMNSMIDAMNDISQKSNEIAKIIKTIDDIAFQTNILALNAAVEAARAGTAGKGFSVVADEVRNLAGKSAEATQNTALLIEQSVAAVSNGKSIADETGKAIMTVVEDAQSVVKLVDDIVVSCNQQEEQSERIKESTDQIDKVVQTNSATSEESAAASEELSAQANKMRELISQFKLKRNNKNNNKTNRNYKKTSRRREAQDDAGFEYATEIDLGEPDNQSYGNKY